MKYKIVAGPTQMIVQRFGYKSEPIDIVDEYITADNNQAHGFYHEHMHHSCQQYVDLRRAANQIEWNRLKEKIAEIVDKTPNLYFDGPSWIVSVVPWKQAEYGQWTAVSKKARWLLKREYTNGIRNRQEETSGVSTLQSGQPSSDG